MGMSTRDALERRGWLPYAFVIVVTLVASIAGLAWNTSTYFGRKPGTAAAAAPAPVPTTAGSYGIAVSPTRIEIPRLGATARIVKVATDADRELHIPENPTVVGWWSPGAKPGARKGTAVLAGHINFHGTQGTFAKIHQLRDGDAVDVYGKYDAKGRKVRFKVTAVRTFHKTTLPYRQIFDSSVAGRLALVTCGGPFDASTGSYLDNVVVYGVPVAA